MSPFRLLVTFPAAVFALALSSACAELPAEDDLRFFRDKIEPVLKTNCYECHSGQAKEIKGGLRLDSRSAVILGGDSGPAIVPGKPDDSLLIQAIRHDGLEMPPEKPQLSAAVIADFVKWVERGAVDPREGETPVAGNPDAPAARTHWAFQPVKRMPLPTVRDAAWPRTAIDAFVLAKLEEQHWRPSPEVSREELFRRLSFDLTGLPPSPEDQAAFDKDESPDSYERLTDRLIASPRFGERQGQDWLDVVRYAETEGYEYDRHVPDAWRFRDYVIGAFNADKPYDQFVREQIAGDELGPHDHELLTASIFHRLGPVRRNAGNPEIALSRNEVLTERTDIIGTAFLGMTIGCARCHNHKLEPIPQKDYYRLQAYLAATEEHNVSLASPADQEAWEAETKRIKAEMDAIKKVARLATGQERVKMQEQLDALEESLPAPLATIPATANDFAKRTPIHVLKRGMWEQKLDAVGDFQSAHAACRLDCQCRPSADGPGDGQPALATSFRHRPRQNGQRLRPARRFAQPWRAARLAFRGACGWRVGIQEAASADGFKRGVPAGNQNGSGGEWERGRRSEISLSPPLPLSRSFLHRSRQPPPVALPPPPPFRRGASRCDAGRFRTARSGGRRAKRDGARGQGAGRSALQAVAVAGARGRRAASPPLDLLDCQAESAVAVHGSLRRAADAHELLAAGVKHARPAGARAAQRQTGRRPGRGIRRAADARMRQ
jgi:hypothetical protein